MKTKYVALYQMYIGLIPYLLHYFLKSYFGDYQTTYMRNYFGDFLALIVCVPLFVNIEIMFGVRKSKKIKLSEIVFFFCVFSILYEIICPYFLNRMTSDVFDVLSYALGGIVLYFSQKIKRESIVEN